MAWLYIMSVRNIFVSNVSIQSENVIVERRNGISI